MRNISEDLLTKIIVEYLPDQPVNRLISKAIRNRLDDRYDEIVGIKNRRRAAVNLEAWIRLKTKNYPFPFTLAHSDFLKVNTKSVLRLLRYLNLRISSESAIQIPSETVKKIFNDVSTLEEYNQIARLIFGYTNFREMTRIVDPSILRQYKELLRRQWESKYNICYNAAYRSR